MVKEKKSFFRNSQGDKLCGILNDPTGDKNKLIVILCHGLRSEKNTNTFKELVPRLTAQSISTFRFDFWGHGESDGNFGDVTVTEAINDVLRAISYIKSLGYKKIGLLGSSFGGNAAIIAASKVKDLHALYLKSPVVDYRGVWNEELKKNWQEQGYTLRKDKRGQEAKLKYSFYKDAITYDGYKIASAINTPMLIVHGDADATVPIEQSKKLVTILSQTILAIVKGADHLYTHPEHHKEMVDRLVDFIIRTA